MYTGGYFGCLNTPTLMSHILIESIAPMYKYYTFNII